MHGVYVEKMTDFRIFMLKNKWPLCPQYTEVCTPLRMFLVRLQNRAESSGEEKSLGLLEICQK
jgi:hypothetical protein